MTARTPGTPSRRAPHGDQAVSSVVAAVLVFALITTASAFWAAVQLPEWEADRERAHRDTALGRLSGLQSDLEALSGTGARGPTGRAIDLAPDPIALVGGPGTTGSLDLVAGDRFQAVFNAGELQLRDGTLVGTPTEAVTVSHGAIASVTSHVVHMTTSGLSANDEATLRWTWTDGTDSVVVDLTHTGSNGGSQCADAELRLEWSGPSGTGREVLLCGADALDGHRVDLLPAGSALRAALGALDRPLSLSGTTLSIGGPSVSGVQALAWTDTSGHVRATGGAAAPDDIDVTGSALRFRPGYQRYPAEDLVWTNGAVIAAQETHAGMAQAPGFAIATAGTQGFVDWTLVVLTGDDGIQGDGEAHVLLTHIGTTERIVTTNDAVLSVEGQGPAWRSFMESELDLHGVTDATVGGTGDKAELSLGTGLVAQWTVRLRVIDAAVSLS